LQDGSRLVTSLADLLTSTHTETIEQLSELVDDGADADLEIIDADGDVEVRGWHVGTVLSYPFSIVDFWSVVRDVEREELRRLGG
jgi:hypothetical protein